MFDKVNEQIQKSLKPMTDLASVNASALQQLAEKQNALFSSLLNEGVAFAEGVSDKKDVNSLVEAQKAYMEGVQEKVVAAAKDAYEVLSSAQEQAGEVLKSAMDDVQSTVANVAKVAK